jgi:hypothetical protein
MNIDSNGTTTITKRADLFMTDASSKSWPRGKNVASDECTRSMIPKEHRQVGKKRDLKMKFL